MGTYEWFDHLPCVAAIVHAETGRLAYVNSDAAEALAPGVAPAELVGVSAYELHPEHAAQWHAENTGVLAAGEPLRTLYPWQGRWYDRRLVPREGGLVLVASRDVTATLRMRALFAHLAEIRLDDEPCGISVHPEVVARLAAGDRRIEDVCAATGLDQATVGYAVRRLVR